MTSDDGVVVPELFFFFLFSFLKYQALRDKRIVCQCRRVCHWSKTETGTRAMDDYMFSENVAACKYLPEETRYVEILNYSVRTLLTREAVRTHG